MGFSAQVAFASNQTQFVDKNTQLTISAVADVQITSSPISLTPGMSDFANGYVPSGDTAVIALKIRANTGWTLKINGTSETWGSSSKPRTDIKVKAPDAGGNGGFSNFTTLPNTATTIYSSTSATNGTTGVTKNVVIRVLITPTVDAPGSYTYSSIQFTLSNS